jgi:hypothetical protein
LDPALWCVVRAEDEIAAGAICTGATYGGGWIAARFTRRPWRKQGADAASDTGAFRLYQRAGMTPVLGWVMYEKALGDGSNRLVSRRTAMLGSPEKRGHRTHRRPASHTHPYDRPVASRAARRSRVKGVSR